VIEKHISNFHATYDELTREMLNSFVAEHPHDLGIAAQRRTLPTAKKAPGTLVGTLESRHSKNDGLSVG